MPADHLRARVACPLHRRLLVVDDKADVAPAVRRLRTARLERDELVADVDEGHAPAAAAQPELAEDRFEEGKCVVDRADLDGNVVDAHRAWHGTRVAAAV